MHIIKFFFPIFPSQISSVLFFLGIPLSNSSRFSTGVLQIFRKKFLQVLPQECLSTPFKELIDKCIAEILFRILIDFFWEITPRILPRLFQRCFLGFLTIKQSHILQKFLQSFFNIPYRTSVLVFLIFFLQRAFLRIFHKNFINFSRISTTDSFRSFTRDYVTTFTKHFVGKSTKCSLTNFFKDFFMFLQDFLIIISIFT